MQLITRNTNLSLAVTHLFLGVVALIIGGILLAGCAITQKEITVCGGSSPLNKIVKVYQGEGYRLVGFETGCFDGVDYCDAGNIASKLVPDYCKIPSKEILRKWVDSAEGRKIIKKQKTKITQPIRILANEGYAIIEPSKTTHDPRFLEGEPGDLLGTGSEDLILFICE